MKTQSPNVLARAIKDFFMDHLPRLRGLSPHTLSSYRDGLVLLLRFIAAHPKRSVDLLDVADIGPAEILAFLNDLEVTRGNTPATRNVRLAGIHAFFRYLGTQYPECLEQAQRVIAIPFKRTSTRTIEYLEYEEVQAVLATVNRNDLDGQRDYAMLVTMFNTGARVQELIDLRVRDLQLIRPFQIRLFGKGRKERICPLWPETADLLRAFLARRNLSSQSDIPLFLNHRGESLTRFGIRYILAKYCERAIETTPTLKGKRLHPHSMRHYPPFLTMSCKDAIA